MKSRRTAAPLLVLIALVVLTLALTAAALIRPKRAAAALSPDSSETFAVTASSTAIASPLPSASSKSATPKPTASPSTTNATLVVLGDDYAKGATWVDDLGQQLGLTVTNLSENGEGYRSTPTSCSATPCQNFSAAAARLAALNPQVVVVEGGEADGDFALDTSAQSALQAITKAVPSAKVIVVSPLSDQFPRPYWLTLHTQAVQKAATAAGATYVDVSSLSASPASYTNAGALTAQAASTLVAAIAKAAQ